MFHDKEHLNSFRKYKHSSAFCTSWSLNVCLTLGNPEAGNCNVLLIQIPIAPESNSCVHHCHLGPSRKCFYLFSK